MKLHVICISIPTCSFEVAVFHNVSLSNALINRNLKRCDQALYRRAMDDKL